MMTPVNSAYLCAYCYYPMREFILTCPLCGSDCHDGDCASMHWQLCEWHHRGVCTKECPFCP